MIRHVYTILCTKAVIDSETNNISLIDSIERLSGPNIPEQGQGVLAISADFVTLWTRSDLARPERGRARVRILDPTGNPCGDPVSYTIELGEFVRVRALSRFSGFPFRGVGVYNLCVDQETDGNWHEEARYPLEVTVEVPVIPVQPAEPARAVQPAAEAAPGGPRREGQ